VRGRDDVHGREAWLRRHGPDPDGTAIRGGVPAVDAAGQPLPKDAPHAGADWVPLGPTMATGGMASDRPTVTGRTRSIALAPGGLRGYVGTAGGGAWMTLDGGDSWTPLDPFLDTPNAALIPFGSGLSIGSMGARFGGSADEDIVFVGVGLPDRTLGTSVRRFGRAGAAGPRVWTDEATNVGRFFSYRVLVPPPTTAGSRDRVWLGSSRGLHERPAAAPFAAWTAIPLPAPYSTPVGTNTAPRVTDVALLPDGPDEWLYVAVLGRGVVRIKLAGGSAVGQPVAPCLGIRESMTALDLAALANISLAAAEDGAVRVYALVHVDRGAQRARLFRLAPTATNLTFARVTGVPNDLWFDDGTDLGDFFNTVAIVPQPRPAPATPTDEVVVAGSSQTLDGEGQASVRRGPVQIVGATPTFTPTAIGRGAHADVSCATFNRLIDLTQDRDDLWIGTDGGAFRSQPTVEGGRFQPAHDGTAAIQLNFLAQHPTVPAFLLAGSQDNGMIIHTGEPAWRRHPFTGDGGGVAADPTQPRWLWQFTKGKLHGGRPPGTGALLPVAFPPTANVAKKKAEAGQVPFYLRLPVVLVPPVGAGLPTTRLAFASHRVWVSNDWGATWRTQPSNTNPLAAGSAVTLDQPDGHPVEQLAWASPSVLLLATDRGVYQINGIGGPVGTPAVATVLARQAATANRGFRLPGEAANAVPPAFGTTTAVPAANVGPLPADFAPSALAAVDAAASMIYLGISTTATNQPLWFQRTAPTAWVSAGLGTFLGGRTRVHAVLVDPANPTDVYAATDVGVYRGVRTDHGAAVPPTWVWSDFSFGLPEASARDLQLWDVPGAGVRLLRVATFGRGAWEIDLERATGRDATAPREPEVFLRVSDTDDGRRVPGVTRLADPLDPTLPTAVPPPRPSGFVQSPDIAVLRARARVVRPWPGATMTGADRQAWRRAAATWGRRLAPTTAAFGAADVAAWQAIQTERLIPLTGTLNERTWRTTFKDLATDPDHPRFLDRYGRELSPPPPAPPAGAVAPPRWQVADPSPGVNRLLVHVRTRGPLPVPAGRTDVVVLWQVVPPVVPIPAMGPPPALPHPGVTLPPLPARWRVGVRTRDLALLSTDGWAVAGAGFVSTDRPVVDPPPLDPENPRVVGIDLDLAGRAIGDLIALFAVVRCEDDLLPGPANPAAADPLRDVATVVTTENRTALRVIQIRDPAT